MYILDEETCEWVIADPELREILNEMEKPTAVPVVGDI
jgi:hypothetical protein